jgi:hypothetical protein
MKNSTPKTAASRATLPSLSWMPLSRTAKLLGLILACIPSGSYALNPVSFVQGQINSESDILNVGSLLVATDLGNQAPAVTVNGVAFGADSMAGLSGWSYGTADFSSQFLTGSPLDKLLSDLDFQGLFSGNASLTLSGLTPGQPYLLQMFLCNQNNQTAQSSRVTIQGQDYNVAAFGTNADYIRATFSASGASEVIQFGTGNINEPYRMILNAYALSAVPEPGTAALLCLGLLGSLLVRRQVRR